MNTAAPRIEVVLPVLNERVVLAQSVQTLITHLDTHCPYPWQITVVDNGSTDGTWEIACDLMRGNHRVHAMRLNQRGRGLALRIAWLQSDAEIVAYMDIDLSMGLDAFLPLIAPLVSGERRVATGSRLLPGARVTRGAKREIISRCYNALIHLLIPHRFSDAQCGFKALRGETVRELVPLVKNNRWFFDTELLLLAEEHGDLIHEVPVRWVEDTDTRVHLAETACEDIEGLLRVRMQRWQRRYGQMLNRFPAPLIHE